MCARIAYLELCRRMHPKIDKYWVMDFEGNKAHKVPYPRVYKVPIVIQWGKNCTSHLSCCLGVVDRDGLARIENHQMWCVSC